MSIREYINIPKYNLFSLYHVICINVFIDHYWHWVSNLCVVTGEDQFSCSQYFYSSSGYASIHFRISITIRLCLLIVSDVTPINS